MSAPGAQAGEPTLPLHEVAAAAWPYMNDDQRSLVDVMARDLYFHGTTPEQKRRISGSKTGTFDSLPEWRKAPFRGIALKQLGHNIEDFKRKSV